MPSFTFKQLAAVANISTSAIAATSLYTAPVGYRALVREMCVVSTDAAAVGHIDVLKGATAYPVTDDVLTGASSVTSDRRLMLEPGDTLRLNVTGAGGVGSTANVLVSGVEISTS